LLIKDSNDYTMQDAINVEVNHADMACHLGLLYPAEKTDLNRTD